VNEDAARDVAIAADLNPRRIVAVNNEVEDAVVSASDPSIRFSDASVFDASSVSKSNRTEPGCWMTLGTAIGI
jgi:hypothetical protein